MFNNWTVTLMHSFVSSLLYPIIIGLGLMLLLALWEIGTAIGERFWVLKNISLKNNLPEFESTARARIERTDILTRVSPMLGLMGTLIPLGPGLSGLGEGNLSILTNSVTIAFDTTVLGLLAGIIGFILGRLRRRWYDDALRSVN
ncbi:MAG: flagellar motor protein MotA [Nitrospinaceae bacterium]|nr:flagellar motor protein MotA [Nitrospina sp.]MBT5376648.1 flagellar motor protein MotA [Nitrospinaceae bacterium]MBT5868490.1 flagellar motor protein MotA [Nitrospinaceae bacterium]